MAAQELSRKTRLGCCGTLSIAGLVVWGHRVDVGITLVGQRFRVIAKARFSVSLTEAMLLFPSKRLGARASATVGLQ